DRPCRPLEDAPRLEARRDGGEVAVLADPDRVTGTLLDEDAPCARRQRPRGEWRAPPRRAGGRPPQRPPRPGPPPPPPPPGRGAGHHHEPVDAMARRERE